VTIIKKEFRKINLFEEYIYISKLLMHQVIKCNQTSIIRTALSPSKDSINYYLIVFICRKLLFKLFFFIWMHTG
jgi:hypothetical protein